MPSEDLTVLAPEGAASRLRAYMEETRRAQMGLVRDDLVRPSESVESSVSPDLMRKVALAFTDQTHEVADPLVKGGRRPANTFERLARAGIPPEVYAQMAQTAEFPRILNRTAVEFVILPQLPAIQAALCGKASSGSENAARVLFELSRLMDSQTVDDVRREYAALDDAAFRSRLREELNATIAMLDELDGGQGA